MKSKNVAIIILCCIILVSSVLVSATGTAKFGDLNGDGNVNSGDALLVLQHSTGLIEFENHLLKAADVNNDGKVTASDALVMLQISVGIGEVKTSEMTTTESTTTDKDDSNASGDSITEAGVPVGTEILSISGLSEGKFLIRRYYNGQIVHILPNTPIQDPNSSLLYRDHMIHLTDVNAKISSSESYKDSYYYYDSDYSIVYVENVVQKYEVTVNFKGNATNGLIGASVGFNVGFWYDLDHNVEVYKETIVGENIIDNDGNFEYSVVYEIRGDISNWMDWDDDSSYDLIKYDVESVRINY